MKLSEFRVPSDTEEPAALLARLRSFNETASAYPRDDTTHGCFVKQAALTPGHVAVYDGPTAVSYAELNRRSNQLARLLIEHGVGREDLVGVMVDRGPEVPTALLGILKAGGAYLPIDGATPVERAAYMLREAQIGRAHV